MKDYTYTNNREGIQRYVHDMRNYYWNQCYKAVPNATRSVDRYGYLDMFIIDLTEVENHSFRSPDFTKALLSIKPYVIARTLMNDSEGYIHAVAKIVKKMKEV